MKTGAKHGSDLTPTLKRALVIMFEDGYLLFENGRWSGTSARWIAMNTVLALYERCLLKIVVESRHRRRQVARLTEIGKYASAEISRHNNIGEFDRRPSHKISERASLLATEISSS